jgi:D-alanyl-lipoteichoic acid acyltransferase DltB (MBOAT superfamily)
MLFNSFAFLLFFALVVTVYYVLSHACRWIALLVASIYFYSSFGREYVLLLVASTLVIYLTGVAIGAASTPAIKKATLIGGVVLSLLPLLIFKYLDFFTGSLSNALGREEPIVPQLNWALPVGLSFYTFSCVSYLADVYRGHLAPERHLGRLSLYVAFFPKLLAGPIERATNFLPQLLQPVRFNGDAVTQGLQLILWGLFKKVVIADRLGVHVDAAYGNPEFASPVALLIATYFFAFQIYCDFSGYTDIAIGTARVLGINLMANFRRPYLATSVPEFWGRERWHISLSSWFRDYLYIPIGGGRGSKPRMYFNQLLVFLVSGLWHGANWTFVIWGALNGLYQVITLATVGLRQKACLRWSLPRPLVAVLGCLVTFHLVLIAWVFFRAATTTDAVTVLTRITQSLPRLPRLLGGYAYTGELILCAALIVFLLLVEINDEKRSLWQRLQAGPVYLRWAVYYALILGLIVLGQWNLKQFVYMQF